MDTLPEELLLNILQFLPGSILMECCLVNKTWKNLITSSSKTMNKIGYHYSTMYSIRSDRNNELDLQQSLNIQRKFSKFAFHGHDIATKHISMLLMAHRQNVTHVYITFNTVSRLHELIQQLPKLEKLEIENVQFTELEPFSLVSLIELKYYINICKEVHYCTESLLEYLEEAPKIKKVSIRTFDRVHSIDFIKKSTTLEEFSASFYEYFKLIINVPFKLKHLTVRFWRNENTKYLLEALSEHEKTLEELTMRGEVQAIHLLPYTFPNLRCLHLDIKDLRDSNIFERIRPFRNVVRMSLSGKFKAIETTEAFLQLFPNLEKLDIANFFSTFPYSLSRCLWENNNVGKMYFWCGSFDMRTNSFTTVSIDLQYRDLDFEKDIQPFFESNRQINALSIDMPNDFKLFREIASAILDLPMLKVLEVQCPHNDETVNAFNFVCQNVKKLQYLKFSSLSFHIPSERTNWDVGRYVAKIQSFIPGKSTSTESVDHSMGWDTDDSDDASDARIRKAVVGVLW